MAFTPSIPSRSAPPEDSLVILIVEDLEDLRSCVAEYLRLVGFSVVEAGSAPQALAAIESGVHIDLVFADINMPGAMDGAGLARWLSASHPNLPIILTSGQPRPELEGANHRHRRFVKKPYTLDALEQDFRDLVAASVTH